MTARAETTSPPALRYRRPGWRDPRLAVGVLLVAMAVLVGARVLAGSDDTTPVWATRSPVSAGEALRTSDLTVVRVRFDAGTVARRYVSAADDLAPGTVVTRDLGAGELVPGESLSTIQKAMSELPLSVPGVNLPARLQRGDTVDVWVTQSEPTDLERAPGPVLRGVPVLAVAGGSAAGPDAPRQVLVGITGDATRLDQVVTGLAIGTVLLVRHPS